MMYSRNTTANLVQHWQDLSDIEASVIGSLMAKPSLYFDVSDIVKPFMFFRTKDLADLVFSRLSEGESVSVITIANEYSKTESNPFTGETSNTGRSFVYEVQKKANLLEVKDYAKKIKDYYVAHTEAENHSNCASLLLAGEDYRKVRNEYESQQELMMTFGEKKISTLVDDIQEAMSMLDNAYKAENGITGIDTGYNDLNKLMGGWQRTDNIIIAGRPGMGKSTSAINLMMRAAEAGAKPLFFTFEMSKSQLLQKINAMYSGVPYSRMRTGDFNEKELDLMSDAFKRLSNMKFEVISDCNTIEQCRDRIRAYKMRYGLDMVFFDYLGLMETDKKVGSTNERVSHISRTIKNIARKCDITTVPLCQLSRAVEIRGGTKRPILSDLRDSGSLEQDADMIIFNYRPEYYQIFEDEEGNSLKGKAEWIIAKNRHGVTKTLERKFIYPYAEFIPIEDDVFREVKDNKPTDAEYSQINVAPVSKMNSDEDIPF